jgi:outer membrane protein TolC
MNKTVKIRSACLGIILLAVQAVFAQDTVRLTLSEAVRIALSENPTIHVADQEIELKKTAEKEAWAGLFPEASLSGSYSRTLKKQSFAMMDTVMQVGTTYNAAGGLSISLPLFAPALYKSISLTKTDVKLAVEKARSSRLDMINQVTKAFYQLLLAQDSYEVLKLSYRQSEDNFRVVSAKYEQGTVSEYDKITAEVQMRSIKPTVVSARNGVNLANLQLKVLLGMSSDLPVAVEGNLKDYEMSMFTRQALPEPNDLSQNTTMKQLELNAQMLRQTLKLNQTNFMPTLAASFSYQYTAMDNKFNIKNYTWRPYSTIGLSLSIPLFKASNWTTLKQTRIQMKQLEENRLNTERQLTMQATSYLDNMAASTESVVSNKEAVYQAQKARDIADKRYQVGKGTILELNSSEVALTESRLTYNQSIYDYLVAKADLDLVIGREEITEPQQE